MKFRPCIDIHNGKVKQIVGGSLQDAGDQAKVNFQATNDADYYAKMYEKDGLTGGHVILLNSASSEFFQSTKEQALLAISTYPKGLQIGGGVSDTNALEYIQAGASHVIVTSFVFKDGEIRWENMKALADVVGKEHVVIDLSCRKREDGYYIVTDRWQKFTNVRLTVQVLEQMAAYCDEYLIHGVDVEGKSSGIDEELAHLLSEYAKREGAIPMTYAGGIASMEDVNEFARITNGRIDFTIGSALDIFGGHLPYEQIVQIGR